MRLHDTLTFLNKELYYNMAPLKNNASVLSIPISTPIATMSQPLSKTQREIFSSQKLSVQSAGISIF